MKILLNEKCTYAVFGINLDIPGLWEGEVEYLLVPGESLLDVHEPEHQRLVAPERPGVLVELGHQLFFRLPVKVNVRNLDSVSELRAYYHDLNLTMLIKRSVA